MILRLIFILALLLHPLAGLSAGRPCAAPRDPAPAGCCAAEGGGGCCGEAPGASCCEQEPRAATVEGTRCCAGMPCPSCPCCVVLRGAPQSEPFSVGQGRPSAPARAAAPAPARWCLLVGAPPERMAWPAANTSPPRAVDVGTRLALKCSWVT